MKMIKRIMLCTMLMVCGAAVGSCGMMPALADQNVECIVTPERSDCD